jgi:hypothetical protein
MEEFTTAQLTQLRDILIKHCTLEDLQIFCADLGADFQIVVPQNATKAGAAEAIVTYFRNRDRLGELVFVVLRAFPNAVWGDLTLKATPRESSDVIAGPTLALLFAAPLIYEAGAVRHPIDLLDFERERDLLFESLTEARRVVNLRITPATVPNLQKITTLGCRVLHYTGHGAPDFLAFEGVDGMAQALENEALQRLLAASANADLRLAFVSACHSRRAGEAFVAAGVPHVVAVKVAEAVLDRAAMRFAQQFYLALLAGKTVQQAFEIGRQAVANDAELSAWRAAADERDKFLLLPEDGDHSRTVFDDAPRGRWQPPAWPHNTNITDKPENFVGRSDDMQQLLARLSQHRLVTLDGFGGIGKTTLARQVGRYLHQRQAFADGIWFIEARNTRTTESLRVQIAEYLQITANDDASLFRALRNKRLLLILDNCEDALNGYGAAFRAFLSGLLKASAELKLLITARQPIGKVGAVAENILSVKRLSAHYAAQLFLSCTPEEKRASIGQALNTPDARAVLAFLGGHPNAILLAAALLNNLSLSQLAREIEQRRDKVLVDPNIPPDERDAQTSMTVSLDISLAQLRARNPRAVQLFGALGLLPGGALPADLGALWGEDWRTPLDDLVRLNLVQQTALSDTQSHYSTFPFVTSYAEAVLMQDKDAYATFANRAAQHYTEVAESAYASLRHNTATFGDVARLLSFEDANMAACFAPARLAQGRPVGDIASNLLSLLNLIDRAQEGLTFGEKGLQACRAVHDKHGEANTLQALGDLNVRTDALEAARANYEAALPIYREIQARLGEANLYQSLGNLKLAEHDAVGAFEHYQNALNIHGDIQDLLGMGAAYGYMARAAKAAGNHGLAATLCESSLEIHRQIQERFGEALNLKDQGDALWALEAQMPALAAWWQACALFRAIQDARNAARLDNVFAQIEAAVGAEKWPSLVAELQANAEAIRQNAIEHIRQQLATQQQPAEDANTG